MTEYEKGVLVMDYLESLGMSYLTIGDAIDDKNFEKSFRLIQSNPHITKDEFLKEMNLEEEEI